MAKTETQQGAPQTEGKTITRSEFVKTQAGYKGSKHSDLVEVEIVADAPQYGYRAGQKDRVHPTTALLLKAKGLIESDGTPVERKKLDQKDVAVDA